MNFEVLQRQFHHLKDYNSAIQTQLKRKNEQIKNLQLEIQTLQNSRRQTKYYDAKDCKNCVMYRSQIITLKDQLQQMQNQAQHPILRQKYVQRQRLASISTNTKASRDMFPDNPPYRQAHSLELQIIEIRGKLQHAYTENAQLKKNLHEKNIELLQLSNNAHRQVSAQRQRITQQNFMDLESMQNRIEELQIYISNNQKKVFMAQYYENENKKTSNQLLEVKQLLNFYNQKIHTLQNQLTKFSSPRNGNLKNFDQGFFQHQFAKINEQKIKLGCLNNQLQFQNRQNLQKIQSLERRINILQNTNQNLQTQLKNSIAKNSMHSVSNRDGEVKHILKNLQHDITDLKQYLMNSKTTSITHQKQQQNIPKNSYYKPNNNYFIKKPHYPLANSASSKLNKSEETAIKQQISKQRSITINNAKQNKAEAKWQHLQKKIGELKNQNQNIKQILGQK